jgi:hypothetical protein
MAKRHDTGSKGMGRNMFALLVGLEVTDEPERMKPRKKKATPPPNVDLKEPCEASLIEKLDSELLSLIFSHLRDGPLLDRLRLVRSIAVLHCHFAGTALAKVRGRCAEGGAG